jgi:hypothetical protein
MDERLSRSNRLPGSEKLTRPEEIGQLSKYLKSIKEVYEESTRLEDQVLGVSGYSTGKIPEVGELGKKLVKAPTNEGENPDLSQKILGVPGSDVRVRLRDKQVKVPDVKEGVKLEDDKVGRPKNINPEVTHLEDVIKKIEGVRNQVKLEDKKIGITDERKVALEEKRLNIQALENPSLRDKRINLSDKREVELEKKRENLKDDREVELGKKREDLSDNRTLNLSDKKLELEDDRNLKLGEKRLDIQDERNQSLGNKRIRLSVEWEGELEDKKVRLKDDREVELGKRRIDLKDDWDGNLEDEKIRLHDDRKIELPDKRENLYDNRKTELPTKRLDLTDDWKGELEDKRENLIDERTLDLSSKILKLQDDQENRLSNKRIELWDDREIGLGDKRLDLTDERENELSDKRLDLTDEREVGLGDKRLDLSDDRDNKLGDKRIDLSDSRELELRDKRIILTDDREVSLSDKILGLKDDRETKLPDKRLELDDDREIGLSDKILQLEDSREVGLEDKILKLEDNRDLGLEDKRIGLEDEREIELEDKREDLKDDLDVELEDERLKIADNENGEPEELYDAFLGLPENENGEPEELYDAIIGMAENKGGDIDSLEDKILKVTENQNKELPDISNIDSLKEYTAGLSDSELYELAMKIANEGEMDGWLSKVESLMSAYLSSDILTPKRAIEFRDAINNTLEMSYFGSRAALRVPVDTSSGTIWAKAEDAIGEQITGTNRRDALDEMIVKMVDYKKISLPGGNILDTVKDNFPKNAGDVISGSISHNYPVNAPIGLNGLTVPGGPGDAIYQAANNRTRLDSLDHVGDVIGNTFYSRYWSSKSFKTTLEDLCPIAGKAPVASLSELKTILKSSPYITTPGKFMTDAKGSYNTMTLDTNMYWEVTIEPYCCDSGSCSNGGYSYLPDIREINYLNKEIHKVRTNYGRWAPINGFELQKSKLQTKSLQLYEGEIAYPSGMEFTNELRLTFVDDSWKSWKRYFERCAQASVFNTNEKTKGDYESEFNKSYITRIDKTNICVASYKNVTFNIKIYILNPQLNLLNRFNLLCVLKDFSEEYVGDIDSGGTDLNVSFSIVGENPEEDSSKKFKLDKEVITSLGIQAALETQKRVTAAINSSVGLI